MGKMKTLLENRVGYFIRAELLYPREPYYHRYTVKDTFEKFITADGVKSIINKVQPYVTEPPASTTLYIYDYYKMPSGKEYKQINRIIDMTNKQCKDSWIEIKFKKTH